jgi:hypothetical protein
LPQAVVTQALTALLTIVQTVVDICSTGLDKIDTLYRALS